MMAAMAVMGPARFSVRGLADLFKALSVGFGGDAEALGEDDIQDLVGRARAGDRAASQRLYRQHVDRVFRTVRSILRSDAEAEDITQDTMLTVLTSLDRYSQRSGIRFSAWVTTIAVNTLRRRFRRRRPEPLATGTAIEIADEEADPERDADRARSREVLLTALGELAERERSIVGFYYGAELNAREIGDLVGLEPANVRKILERSRVRLGARIEALLGPNGGRS